MAEHTVEVISQGEYNRRETANSIMNLCGNNEAAKWAIGLVALFIIPLAPLVGIFFGIKALLKSKVLGGKFVSIASIVLGVAFTAGQIGLIAWMAIEGYLGF